MKSRNILVFVAVGIIFIGCAPSQDLPNKNLAGLDQFRWIIGTWEAQGPTRTIVERWILDSTGAYRGVGFMIKGNDTTVSEKMRLVEDSSGVHFVADVPQNETEIRFRLGQFDSTGALFANPEHDYPKIVCYRPVGTDSLYVWIDGPIDGKPKRQDFSFRRVK